MPESPPANTMFLGDNAYLIKSPAAGTTDCIVMAHGGSLDKTQKFTVPAGVTLRFFVNHGDANKASAGPLGFISERIAERAAGSIVGQASDGSIADKAKNYGAGMSCPDYLLVKVFGTGWESVASRASYQQARAALDTANNPGAGANWVPHIVTVRKRTAWGKNRNIWLSSLVELIIGADPTITTIYCGNCRGSDEDKAKKYLKTVGKGAYGSAGMTATGGTRSY